MRHRVDYLLTASFFVLFFFVATFAQDHNADAGINFVITSTEKNYENLIKQNVPEPFFVNSIDVETDSSTSKDEILYLLDFKNGTFVDAAKISTSVHYLFLKNKFSSIEFQLSPSSDSSRSIVIKCSSFWTLRKLKIKGFMVGKEMYRQWYLIEPGTVFDETKHRESLGRIIDQFKEIGYFKAAVDDEITYNDRGKTVDVSLRLLPGPHFTIDVANLQLTTDQQMEIALHELQKKVHSTLIKKIQNKKYSKNLLNKEMANIKKFLLKNGYGQVAIHMGETINRDAGSVQITIDIELKKGKEITFFGNYQLTADQLLDSLLSFGVSVYSIPPSLLAQELIDRYKEKGFWNVSVTAREEGDRLFFIINEGNRAVIKKIVIKGMHFFDPKTCIDTYFDALLSSCSFNSALLNQATSALIDLYNKNGFFDAKIDRQEIISLEGTAECALELTIHEGDQYVLKKIIIEQFSELEDRCPGAGSMVACTRQLLESQKKWLGDQLTRKGFPGVSLALELTRENKSVIASWHAELNRANNQFGKTVVIGNGDLPAGYLLRELAYKPGDSFNLERVRQSLKKLRSLDLFDSISLIPDSSYQLPEKPMILHIEPSDPFELRLRFGIGLQELTRPVRLSSLTYKCGGQFMIKNPFNFADKINVNVELTRAYSDIMMRYDRPWIFDTECNFFVQGYSSSYKQPGFFRIKEGLYQVWHQGFSAGLSHDFDYAQTAVVCGIEWDKTEIRKQYAAVTPCVIRALALAPCFLDRSYPYFFVEPSLVADFTDRRINPSRGSFTIASIKCIVPLVHDCTQCSSLKFLLDQSFYAPISWATLAGRARFGYIMGIPLEDIQLIERFYMGGAHSIRSYFPDCAPPLGSFCDPCGKHQFVPQGGKLMAQATVEARFPFKNGLSGIVFQDLGTLSDNPMSVVKGWKMLSATGFGVCYDTPIGPLRFDIGFKWACHSDIDARFAWYFSLGNPF